MCIGGEGWRGRRDGQIEKTKINGWKRKDGSEMIGHELRIPPPSRDHLLLLFLLLLLLLLLLLYLPFLLLLWLILFFLLILLQPHFHHPILLLILFSHSLYSFLLFLLLPSRKWCQLYNCGAINQKIK